METRYAYVARQLTQSIRSGDYPVGSILPNEFALADQFNVSRVTIRAALKELQQLGMVSRRRNAGTRVEALRPVGENGGYSQSLGTVDDVAQYAAETERRIQEIAEEVADTALSARLGCMPGRRWLRVSHMRVRADQPDRPPICWTDLYIDALYADDLRPLIPAHRGLIGTLVEQRTGRRIAEIRQQIAAVGVPARIAGPLRTDADGHALEITRRYLDGAGEIFLVSVSVHPADRFTYEMRLLRRNGAEDDT